MSGKKIVRARIDTRIKTLGPTNVDSPLSHRRFVSEEIPVRVQITSEDFNEIEGEMLVELEPAGPREKIFFEPAATRAAIVTCGGLCPGLNDVIRSLVMESHYNYGIKECLGIPFGLEGFMPEYGHEWRRLTPDMVSEINGFGGTILASSRGPQPASAIVDALQQKGVSILFIVGGDGTMKAARTIHDEAAKRGAKISVVGVPKTIDNDIEGVDPSFGFGTAVAKAADALGCAHAESKGAKNGIGLVKLMGRESGFIAAHAALANRVVNFVLIPECPFSLEGPGGLLPALEARLKARGHAVIVAAEGAGQELFGESGARDASGNPVLGDVCSLLRQEIKRYLDAKGMEHTLKFIDPSYTIRAVPADPEDRIFCGFLGRHAVHAAMAGKTGLAISKVMGRYVHLPFEVVTSRRRRLNIDSDYWSAVLESTGQYSPMDMCACGKSK